MWCLVKNKKVVQTFRRPKPLTIENVQYPSNIFTLWPKDKLKTLGIYEYREKKAPAGERITSTTIKIHANYVEEIIETESIPEPEDTRTYREKRKEAYASELGVDSDFINTLGDVIDILIKELDKRGTAVTSEYKSMKSKIKAIKTRFPKE